MRKTAGMPAVFILGVSSAVIVVPGLMRVISGLQGLRLNAWQII
jgi:hypothetical protein